MHQHENHGKNKKINYFPQIEHYKNTVDDKSIKLGGDQHANTLDNYKLPMSIRNTLPYVPLRLFTYKEWEQLTHVIFTFDMDWDPIVLDCEGEVDNEEWFSAKSSFQDGPTDESFDGVKNYRFRNNNHQIFFFDAEIYDLDEVAQTFIDFNNVTTKSNELEC